MWLALVVLQNGFGISITEVSTLFLTLNPQRTAAVSEHGHESGQDIWLQAQLSFFWPITAHSQKGSLLTTCADGQETAEWKGLLETRPP